MLNRMQASWLVIMILASCPGLGASDARGAPAEAVLVGRVALVEGMLLRYVPDEEDWVVAVEDSPFGLDDALYSDESTRAEFSMPNLMRARIGGNTQIQMIALNSDLTSLDVASGMARLINDGQGGMLMVSTPFGHAVSEGASTFDLHVGDESVEVKAFRGSVDFIQERYGVRYTVNAGELPLISDGQRTSTGENVPHADWYAWNDARDQDWGRRIAVRGESIRYLPEGLHNDAHVLDEHGRWEQVRYRGEDRHFWRPTGGGVDYAPFTAGRWTLYHGDNVWMPYEPFGYVTHHYGNWIHLGTPGAWYWMPPAPAPLYLRRPSNHILFSWFPGRVVWLHSAPHVGWIPLTPFEPYYAHRYWGPRTVVVREVTRFQYNVSRFHHAPRAVVIDRRHLYDVHDYRPHRIRGLDRRAILRDYRAAPVLSNRVLPGYDSFRYRHHFRNVEVSRLPALQARERIERNRRPELRREWGRRQVIEQRRRRATRGDPARDVRLERPRSSSRFVSREEFNRAREDRRQRLRQERRQTRPTGTQRQQEQLRQQRESERRRLQQERARTQRLERQRQERDRRQRQEQLRQQRESERRRLQQERVRTQRLERQRQESDRRQRRQQLRRRQNERAPGSRQQDARPRRF